MAALETLNAERPAPIRVRQSKYLNNLIILSGIEIMYMIRKGQMRDDGVASTAAGQFYSLTM